MIRIPLLLQTSLAVIYRLDPAATTAVTPHAGVASGYDPDFREPITHDQAKPVGTGTIRTGGRQELAPIRVPCQFETYKYEELEQRGSGAQPDTDMTLVLHRMDLEEMGLLDPKTGVCGIKCNDRVSAIEYGPGSNREGDVQWPFAGEGLYVRAVAPGGIGFGPGSDLVLVTLKEREEAV